MSRKSKGIPLSCLSASAQAQALAKLAELDRPPVITPEQADAIADRSQWAPYRNKTEWRFAQWLADWGGGPGRRITYEALRLPLASIDGRPSYYMPDFQAWRGTALVSIYEVKGGHRWRRQGIDRLRAAAAAYPEWEWWLAEPNGHGWSLKRVEG